MKIKGLLSELDEIRAQRETAGLQSDHVRVTTQVLHCREIQGSFLVNMQQKPSLHLLGNLVN